jgi:purine nucleoside permease
MPVVQFPAAGRAARLLALRRELPRAQAHQAPEINQPPTPTGNKYYAGSIKGAKEE